MSSRAGETPTSGEPVASATGEAGAEIRIFLFADIRGYTRFTQERGDEAAARLARKFTDIAREVLEGGGGSVIELAGDEALTVFSSARQALRAAVALQGRFGEETAADPTLPFRVGMGLDAGEAVLFEDGYRGASLNVAARLCAMAAPGEVLATQEVVHLARRVEGLRFLEQGPLRLKGIEHPVQAMKVVVEAVNPYKGLRAFDEHDAPDFFGREALTQQIVARLSEPGDGSRFLAVVGPSGSGKSSVVRAGVVPALRGGALPGARRCLVADMLPGQQPMKELAAVLERVGVGEASAIDEFRKGRRDLASVLTDVLPPDAELVLVIDQFEELFTLVEDDALRAEFLENLVSGVLDPSGRLRCVVTLRADLYDRPLRYKAFGDLVGARTQTVTPLSPEELERAISGPAERMGVVLEPGLVAQMVADVSDEPGALPLLQYALTELFEQRRGNTMTLEAYRAVGGVSGALVRRAESIYASLDDAQRHAARQLFLRLTTPVDEADVARRRVPRPELLSVQVDATAMEAVIDAFGTARLLSFDRDPVTGNPTVDVSHEALIRGWPRLREWLDEDRAGLLVHRRLTEAAQEWERAGRDPEALYRGVRFAQATEFAERNRDALNALEAHFVRESVDAQEAARRRRQRRVRVAAGSLAAGLVVVAALALVAFLQKARADDQRRLARSREIAATALEQLDRDPELTLLLAIEAYETAPTSQAEAAVRRALVNSRLRRVLRLDAPPGEVFLDVSPTGSLIAAGTPEGSIVLWDRGSGKRLAVLKDPNAKAPPSAKGGPEENPFFPLPSFSPDGKRLFAGQPDGSAVIWSVPDGRLVTRLDLAFAPGGWTPDSRAVLTMGADEVVRLRDAATGRSLAQFRRSAFGRGGGGPPARLSADGRIVAMSDGSNVRIARVATGRTVAVVKGYPWSFSRDGRHLVAGEDDGSARVVDVASGRPVSALETGSHAYSTAFSPDGERVITGHPEGARIWDVRSGRRILELTGHGGDVYNVAFSPDGRIALTASEDSTARLWDAETGRLLAVLAGHAGSIQWATFTPDGGSVVTSSGFDEVRIWEVGGGETALLRGHEGPITRARFSPGGRTIISAGVDGTARAWDVATRRQTLLLRPPGPPRGPVLFADAGPDDRLAVVWAHPHSPSRVWDLATGKVRIEIPTPQDDPLGICPGRDFGCPVNDAALSPDGTRLATAGLDGFLRIWDAAKGTKLREIRVVRSAEFNSVEGVEWTRDGTRLLVLGGDGVTRVFDATTFRTVRELKQGLGDAKFGHGPEASADGSLVAVGYDDRTARIWDTATGRLVAELPHAGPVFDVGFSPDGRFLVTASSDAPTIWDLESQRPLVQLFGHRAGVLAAEFSPDGSSILSGGVDRTIRIWRCEVCAPIDELLPLARSRVLRELTPAERAKYLHE